MAAAGMLHRPMTDVRKGLDTLAGQPIEAGKFPELTVLQAMPGGMRALAVDALWMRSQDLKEEGRFYDAAELASLICKLQPRFPNVWMFHSWNLAYNISVATNTAQERWKWITDGVNLLRDEGIPYNPNSIDLYQQLSFIYSHKVGGQMDDMHVFYKRYLAGMYHRVLGAPPHSGKPEDMAAWLTAIVDAPGTEDELLADPATKEYVSQLDSNGVHLNSSFLDHYNAWSNDALVRTVGQPVLPPRNDSDKAIQRLMTDEKLQAVRARTLAYVRRHELVNVYKLDPAWMLELTRKYGPLDWRSPFSHGLYWSTYGVQHCKGFTSSALNSMAIDRDVLNSLKDLTTYGQILLTFNPADPTLPDLMYLPEWRFVDAAHKEHVAMGERVGDTEDRKSYQHFQDGHINFLVESIQVLWLAGQDAKAQELLDFIRDHYKPRDPQWKLPLEDLVVFTTNADGVPRHQVMLQLLFGLARRAYLAQIAGNQEECDAAMDRVRYFWQKYQADTLIPDRSRIRDFTQIQVGVSSILMEQLPLLAGSTLYAQLPVEIQRQAYDFFAPPVAERCQAENLEFAKLFPEPPGLKALREEREKIRAAAKQDSKSE